MNDSVSSSANLCPVIEGLIQAHKAIELLSYIALFIYLFIWMQSALFN